MSISGLLHICFWVLGFALLWRIPTAGKRLAALPPLKVTVIIPARNEEKALARLLASLRDPAVAPEIIVVDDHSEDATAETARRAGFRVIPSAPLPDGWAGKPWACWQAARMARGDLLFFLDADTVLEPAGLGKILSAYLDGKGLLSIQPYHRMERAFERLSAFFNIVTMAGMNAFAPWGGKGKPTGAFGPCNVCSKEDYFAAGGHAMVRGDVLESLGLGKRFLEANLGVRLMGGRGAISFRMYPGGMGSLIEGFAKGFASGAGAMSPSRLIMPVCWIAGGAGVLRHLLQSLIVPDPFALCVSGMTYSLYVFQIHWMLRRFGNFGFPAALLFPLPLLFFIGVFAVSCLRVFFLGRVRWKGRTIDTVRKGSRPCA
ncbi:MAG TPA: glycosyltransferase [Thermodesulfobacteriota bacterium]|nr:glycosyltransferase [Thermodesulfobacteriota bacterium]